MSVETKALLAVFGGIGVIILIILIPILWKQIDKLDTAINTKVKKHIFFSFFDVLSILVLCIGIIEFKGLIGDLHSKAAIIELNNMIGYCLGGFLMPVLHSIAIIEDYKPAFAERHKKIFGKGFIVAGITLFVSAILLTYSTRSIVVNKNYYRCNQLEGLSAFSNLIYTIDSSTCLEQVEVKTQKSLSAR